MPYNNVLVICSLLALATASIVPRIAKRYLVIQSTVSATGTLILAAAVIHDNLSGTLLNLRSYPFLEPLAFALFVFSQGWVAAENVFADERRLLSIEDELAIAREIQASILPSGVPELSRLRISAAYLPMTARRFLLVYRRRSTGLVSWSPTFLDTVFQQPSLLP